LGHTEGETTAHEFEVGTPTNHSNIYWDSEQPGWGLTLSHQGDTIFALWHTLRRRRSGSMD